MFAPTLKDKYTPDELQQMYEANKSPQDAAYNPNVGWKLHLNVAGQTESEKRKNAEPVVDWLNDVGILHKVMHNSGQEGKDMTVYIGSKDMAAIVAREIDTRFSDKLLPPAGDTLSDDTRLCGNVWGRFNAQHVVINGEHHEFHQYGKEGISFLKEDQSTLFWGVFDTVEERKSLEQAFLAQSGRILKKAFGEFFTGTPEIQNAIVNKAKAETPAHEFWWTTHEKPEKSEKTAPQEEPDSLPDWMKQEHVQDIIREKTKKHTLKP